MKKGGFKMGKKAVGGSEMPEKPNMEIVNTVRAFKFLYLDWLRFFRANIRCGWQCPQACPLPEECSEVDRVWNMWLDTLSEVERALLN